MSYYVPRGGLPPQTALTTDRAIFTEAYAVIPARTLSDITASYLPGWDSTRLWVLARPLSGFAETFSWYVVEVAPGDHPQPGVVPVRQAARDDVGHGAARQHGVRLGEDGTTGLAGRQVGLRRQPATRDPVRHRATPLVSPLLSSRPRGGPDRSTGRPRSQVARTVPVSVRPA